MKVYRIPTVCSAIIFDMDNTLYTHPEYARTQIDLPIAKLARIQGKTFDAMNSEIKQWQKNWSNEHEGKKISLGNTLCAFGIDIAQMVKWREELYQPEQYLTKDQQLCAAMEKLSLRFTLTLLTNNPVSVARRTLAVLGVEQFFHAIAGLDTCGVSKPHVDSFTTAARLCEQPRENCLSVGDRFDIDLAFPLELGMGAILVDGVQDVYQLPNEINS